MFFSFDGIDGAGKSTQIDAFCQWLDRRGVRFVRARDPGSTTLGELLRELILQRDDVPLAAPSEMLLYMAARAQLVEQIIRPALAEQKVVVCDRFALANVAYQGYGGGLEPGSVWTVAALATAGVQPDCTFLLDLPVEQALGRLGSPTDRLERRGSEFLERVRQGFLLEAQRRPEVMVINADRPPEVVQEDVRRQAAQFLER